MENGNNGNRKCYKFQNEVKGNLNITRGIHHPNIHVFWTKYQLFIHENSNFDEPCTPISPEFEINQILCHERHCLCLDSSGYIYIETPSSLVNTEIKETGVITCAHIPTTRNVLSLKKFHKNKLKLLVSKLDTSFQSQYVIELATSSWFSLTNETTILACCYICEHTDIKKIFKVKDSMQYNLVIITPDKRNVYGCLINASMSKCNMHKLYESSADVVDIKIFCKSAIFYVLLALACGAVIMIPLNSENSREVIHLTTAIHKIELFKESIIYTDGKTLWRMNNLLSKDGEREFKQFFVRNVRDFCISGRQIICVTFANIIYSFDANDESSYVDIPATQVCPTAQELISSDILREIMKVIKINEELVKEIKREKEYLTILALSNRPDIMENLIQITCDVYDSYNDVIEENTDLILTDDPCDYLNSESYYFLLCISVLTIQHKLRALIRAMLEDVKIHVTMTADKVLKTTSITYKEQLKKQKFVMSLEKSEFSFREKLQINVKIITNIPGSLDDNQELWVTLYKKNIVFNAESFINTHLRGVNTMCLKEKISLSKQIMKTAEHYHNTLFRFNKKHSDWSFHLKLPHNYREIFTNNEIYQDYLHPKKVLVLQNKMEQLLSTANNVEFKIGDIKVQVEILNEGSTSWMKVSSENIMIASDLRNFFSNLMFQGLKIQWRKINHEHHVPNCHIETIKSLRNEISLYSPLSSHRDFLILMTKFQKVILGPLFI